MYIEEYIQQNYILINDNENSIFSMPGTSISSSLRLGDCEVIAYVTKQVYDRAGTQTGSQALEPMLLTPAW